MATENNLNTLTMSPELVPKYTQSLTGSLSTVVSSLFSFPSEMLLQVSLLQSRVHVWSKSFIVNTRRCTFLSELS